MSRTHTAKSFDQKAVFIGYVVLNGCFNIRRSDLDEKKTGTLMFCGYNETISMWDPNDLHRLGSMSGSRYPSDSLILNV